MRAALEHSIARHGGQPDAYEKGSIVICTSCARPLYRLERGIGIGEKAGSFISAFAPVRAADLVILRDRTDVDAGVRAHLKTEPNLAHYADRIATPRTGQPALCPFCDQVFVQGRSVEVADTRDRAYVWELVTIPPTTGRQGLSADVHRLGRGLV